MFSIRKTICLIGAVLYSTVGIAQVNPGTSPLSTPKGGTGANTLTSHGLLVGNGTNPIGAVTLGTDGQLLIGQTGAAPAFKTQSGDCTTTALGVISCANIPFLQSGTGAVSRTVQNKLQDTLSVLDYGALCNDSHDDSTAFATSTTAAISTGRAILLPMATCKLGSTWTISTGGVKVLSSGAGSILHHTGTGHAVDIDGGSGESQNIFGVQFGGSDEIGIKGNTNTTDCLMIRGSHHMIVNVNIRDCTTGLDIKFTVLSDIRIVGSHNEGAFIKQPTNILKCDERSVLENSQDNEFWVIAEGSSGYGVDLINCKLGTFYGSSEGNDAGGVYIEAGSQWNTFINMDNEENGSAPDWNVAGTENLFLNSLGAISSSSLTISGINNEFIGGFYDAATINLGADHNRFLFSHINGLTDNTSPKSTTLFGVQSNAGPTANQDPLTFKLLSGSPATAIDAATTSFFAGPTQDAAFYNAAGTFVSVARVTGFTVFTTGAPGGGQTYVFTLYKNNTSTGLTCTISSGNTCSPAAGAIEFAAGDRWALQIVTSAAAASTGPINFGVQWVTP